MTIRGRRPVATLALLVALAALPPSVAAITPGGEVDAGLAADLQAVLDDALERPIVGLAASVIMPDGSSWASGSGLLELGAADKPMLGSTPSVVGSITKTFVASLILELIEEGRFSLRTRLSRWFPEYPFARHVRVRHLLRHSSGLRDYFSHPDYASLVFGRPTHYWTTDEILTLVRPRLAFTPGRGWLYSNTNFLFLGLIAQRVTGRPLADELRMRYFEPLGLAETVLQGTAVPPTEAAYGYLLKKGVFKGFADGSPFRTHTSAATVAWAAGGVAASARDTARWMRTLHGGSLLEPVSLAAMTTFNAEDYGLGTQRLWLDGLECHGHTGSLRGYTAVACHHPASGVTIALLTNRGRIDIKPIAAQLLEIAVARAATDEAAPAALGRPSRDLGTLAAQRLEVLPSWLPLPDHLRPPSLGWCSPC